MLNVCPADRCRALGSQRDPVATAVLEGVHLLLHDVGAFTDAAKEQIGLLEYRRIEAPILEEPADLGGLRLDEPPIALILGQDVFGSPQRSEHVQCLPFLLEHICVNWASQGGPASLFPSRRVWGRFDVASTLLLSFITHEESDNGSYMSEKVRSWT